MISKTTYQLSVRQNQPLPSQRQIVIIDPQIDDYQILAAAVLPGVELLILNPDRDGISQITDYLQKVPRLPVSESPHLPLSPTLHLISHGSPGRLHLGNSTLELNNIEQYRPQLEKWGIAHLYIYGCKVAAGDAGAEFLQKLHQITQAQIYANPKPTGNAAKGGTWELQQIHPVSPSPRPEVPFSPQTRATYPHTLGFTAQTTYAAGNSPRSITVGDFNGDNQDDLAVVNFYSNHISVLLGNGDGSFSPQTTFAVGTRRIYITVGDFNGDNQDDIAVANFDNQNISVLLGNGYSSFSPQTTFAVGSFPVAITVGDFNGDNQNDLAVVNFNSNNISVLLGNGYSSFSPQTTFAVGSFPIYITLGDFNGDNQDDLAVANRASNNISILLGNGSGSFSPQTTFAAGTTPRSITVGDFNGDNQDDLAVVNRDSNNISILLGNGSGSFSPQTTFAAGTSPVSITIGDYNGDNQNDLAVANANGNNISVLLGNGSGSFSPQITFAAGTSPYSMTVGDFNGDNRDDLAVANLNGNNISVLLNTTPKITTVTSTTTDGSYKAGETITITIIFDAPVTVTGTPQLQLETGTTDQLANYTGGSGTNTLSFNYIVQPGDTTADLDYLTTTALTLNGGTIKDNLAVDADLTLPSPGTANSLSANKNLIIDTTPPTVTVEQAAAQTDPATTSPINFTVTFSEPVTSFDPTDINFTGTPTTGTLTPTITGSGNTYNVAVSGMNSSGNVIVSVNANAVTDAAGNNNTASISRDNTVTYNTIPTVANISKTADEDTNITFTDTDFTAAFTDVDNDILKKIQITSLPTNGTLKLGGVDITLNKEIPFTYIPNLTFIPAANFNGNSSFTWNGSDGSNYATTTATVNLTINPVNDAPSFTANNPTPVNEDSGAIAIPNWATFNPGPPDEASQTATYTISNITNPGLFSAIPTVDSSGTLSYTPTADANGISTFDVVVQDNSGGNNIFPAQTFTIVVNPVNDAPSFSNLGNQTLSTWTNSPQTVNNWANTFIFGPTNENRQTVADFLVNVISGNTLFTTPPDIANNGTLTYTPTGAAGTATISVQLQDNGGLANSGNDTSTAATFTITIPPPTVNLGVIPNSGSEAGTSTITITATAAGPVFGNQTLNLALSGTADNSDFSTPIPNQITIPDGATTGSVTLTIAQDSIAEGDETATLTISNPTAGIQLGTATNASFTITDNDTAGITVTPISLTTTEAGGMANFTVVLNSQPTADVTINLTSDNTAEGTVIPSLTFTPANWNQPQTVTVTGVDDNLDDGDINYNIITAPATSTDPNYNNFNAPDVVVTNTDNDTAGITVSASTVNITEGGANGTYDLVLTSAPTAPVTINFTTDAEINPIAPIIFDSTNWNQPQIVTVTAVDDSNIDRLHLGNITHSVVSNDSKYNGMTISPVVANIADNDSGGVSIMQPLGSTDVLEGFGTDVYKLVLTLPPVADVTIALNTDDQITTHVPTVTFTPSNWNLPQTVTVTAVDDREPEGNHQGNITHIVTSADPAYNNLKIPQIIGNISDNDNRGKFFQLSPPSIIGLTSQDDIVTGSTADDMVYDAAGNDVIDGGEGHDNLYAQAGDDGINGGSGNDVIWAGLGNDHATGLGGNDILYGGEGNDRLYGDDGDDFLLGNSGNDFLFAGTGIDNLTGGTGRDAFVLSNGSGGMTVAEADIITDFVKGEDIFYLSGNLNFPQLVISQGMGNLANDGIIQNAVSGEFLAVVKGVAAADIPGSDFV